MKWLCIHGTGSSAAILQHQLAPIHTRLQQLGHSLHFIDADYPCPPAAGIDHYFPKGPHYSWWENPTSVPKIRKACERFHEQLTMNREAPYEGIISFSRGCLLVKSYILFHQSEKPNVELPFKAAAFLCGGPVLSVLEELGMTITPKAREWDKRTKIALRERACTKAILKLGKQRWLTPGENGDSELNIDPTAPIDPTDIYGLNSAEIPNQLRIRIPTAHVYGRVDPRFPASMQLIHLCDPASRVTYEHPGGHNIPKSSPAAEDIAHLIDRCALMAGGKR